MSLDECDARQTGLEGQFNRANYDAKKTTTVSNLKLKIRSHFLWSILDQYSRE